MQPGSPSVTSELHSVDEALADRFGCLVGVGINTRSISGLDPFVLVDERYAFEEISRRSLLTSGAEESV